MVQRLMDLYLLSHLLPLVLFGHQGLWNNFAGVRLIIIPIDYLVTFRKTTLNHNNKNTRYTHTFIQKNQQTYLSKKPAFFVACFRVCIVNHIGDFLFIVLFRHFVRFNFSCGCLLTKKYSNTLLNAGLKCRLAVRVKMDTVLKGLLLLVEDSSM